MPRYMHYGDNQDSMVVINFEEQIQPGTFEYALHHLISDRLDLTPFDELYIQGGKAGDRPANTPAILLKIILFVYSRGITSSRDIQWCCEHNIIFIALSCDSVPQIHSRDERFSDQKTSMVIAMKKIGKAVATSKSPPVSLTLIRLTLGVFALRARN